MICNFIFPRAKSLLGFGYWVLTLFKWSFYYYDDDDDYYYKQMARSFVSTARSKTMIAKLMRRVISI